MEPNLIEARIDLEAVARNVKQLKDLTEKGTQFMAVVKADGYGHGAVPVARRSIDAGADRLGVARLEEAVELRLAEISAPILVFGHVPAPAVNLLTDNNLTATVYGKQSAKALSDAAVENGVTVRAHLKVDTGMGRVGLLTPGLRPAGEDPEAAAEEVRSILELPGLDMEGIYTHFAAADSRDKTYTRYQLDNFNRFLEELEAKNIRFDCVHAANSAGIIDMPNSHFDMVRAGISLYGLYPSPEVDRSGVKLRPAMEIAASLTSVRRVPEGFRVSYGMTYATPSETCLASVPVGYADGFSRHNSSSGFMLVHGQRAPIAGRVCMDQTMIDIGDMETVSPGDEVMILGKQGEDEITADEIAERIGTINYEVVSALTSRVPRIYI
ncbi:MAG: alanine racemase [Desulfarculaceae bacterium]|nr:alanine racemase [Desulfarculaceae bacterium]